MAARKKKAKAKGGRPKGSRTVVRGRLTSPKVRGKITGQPERPTVEQGGGRARVVALRVREVEGVTLHVPPNPSPKIQLALAFDAWYQTLPPAQQDLLHEGIDVPVPVNDDSDEEFRIVRSAVTSPEMRMNPWDRFRKVRGRVSVYATTDFMCEFTVHFRDATGHKYTFRGGFAGDDYKKVFALKQTHGNQTLHAAILLLMDEYKKTKRKKSRLNLKTAPTISVLSAFFNDIVALLGDEHVKKGRDEQADAEDAAFV